MTPQYSRTGRCRDAGAVLVFSSALILAILAFAALALDMGQTANNQTQLKAALDAGALRAASYLRQSQDDNPLADPQTFENQAAQIAREVTRLNLLGSGLEQAVVDQIVAGNSLIVEFENGSTQVNLLAPITHDTWIAGALGMSDQLAVTVQSKASFGAGSPGSPADITFVVDVSTSMNSFIASGVRKIDALRESLMSLVAVLPSSVRISIVKYNRACDVVLEMTQMDEDGKETALMAISSDVVVNQSGTNIACGLWLGHQEMQYAENPSATVLMTDGEANHNDHGVPTDQYDCGDTDDDDDARGNAIGWADAIKAELGVPVYSVGFAADEQSGIDPDFLRRVGNVDSYTESDCDLLYGPDGPPEYPSGEPVEGGYFFAASTAELLAAFSDSIASVLTTEVRLIE